MTRQRIMCLIACFMTVTLVLVCIGVISPVLEQKTSRTRYDDFYKQRDFDVLYLGTSHVQNGFIPFELWQEYGITSYNLSAAGCRIPTMYWQLRSALEYAKPSVVILDCAYLMNDKHNMRVIEYNHTVFDHMPMSRTRIHAIFDLFDDWQERLRFLLPFSVYHSRWSELTKADFEQARTHHYGFGVGFEREPASFPAVQKNTGTVEIDNAATEYLTRIADLCLKENIDLYLTMIPFSTLEQYHTEEMWIENFAKECNIPFWCSSEILELLEPMTDFANFSDDNSHVNYAGALKITHALGARLLSQYDLPDRRDEVGYDDWNMYASDERAYFFESVSRKPDLWKCLQLSVRDDIETEVILGSEACFQNTALQSALHQEDITYRVALPEDQINNPLGVRITLTSRDGYGTIRKDFAL